MATYQIPPPTPMSLQGDVVENWKTFEDSWADYLLATELNTKLKTGEGEDAVKNVVGCTQVAATLCAVMGPDCKKILSSLPGLTAEKKKDPDEIITLLRDHFVPQRNVVYERFVFNNAFQKDETADQFVLRLRQLAESCEYGTLKESLIRDRIIAGTSDEVTKERLLRERPIPTLERAIEHLKSAEISRQHKQAFSGNAVDHMTRGNRMVQRKRKQCSNIKASKNESGKAHKTQSKCDRCGAKEKHNREVCPAKKAECHLCKKKGHYAKLCRSKSTNEIEDGEDSDDVYLGEVKNSSADFWSAQIAVNGNNTEFKLDSGSKITVVSDTTRWIQHKELETVRSNFRGPGGVSLNHLLKGVLRGAELQVAGRVHREDVYVMENQTRNLLSKHALQSLQLLKPDPVVYNIENAPDFREEFPDLFKGLGRLKTPYHIALREESEPVCLYAPRRVPHPLVAKVKQELDKMEKSGVISKVLEPTEWCSGLVVVPKPSGDVRICVDLTALNKAVKREIHPMATVDENLAKIQGSSLFTKLDANSGFWQIPLDDSSRHLTTFVTSEGRYCFNRLPFGISSAPEIFQRLMSQMLEGLDGVICHMDDILIHGTSQDQHDRRVRQVLRKLQESGMTLNDKCRFSEKKITFLGHIISKKGIEADPQKTKAVQDLPAPSNVTELQRFNGMVNQLAKFIPNLAQINEPLRQLLRKDNEWIWSQPQDLAFKKIKEMLTSPAVLAHYNVNTECIVAADASQYGIGAVLLQVDSHGNRRPISYASRSLSDTEKRYAVIEKEALASIWACEKFNDYLLGRPFQLETDHRPLVPLLSSTDYSKLPPRILRFRLRMMKYCPKVVYVQGIHQKTADTLSRAPTEKPTLEEEVKVEEVESEKEMLLKRLPVSNQKLQTIREAQEEDAICSEVKSFVEKGWPPIRPNQPLLKPYFDQAAHFTVNNGLLMYDMRLVIPTALRMEILARIHEGHLGITKCKGRAYDSVWWPNVTAQVEAMCQTCSTCNLHQEKKKESLIPLSTPDEVWERVGTDLFHMNQKDYIVIVDYGSKWLEVKELKKTSSSEIIKALRDVFATHGAPKIVVSDNGPQYASVEFQRFAREWGFSLVTSSPMYPRANGEAERAVRTAKNILKKNADFHLGLLAYRSAPLHNGFTPSQLLMSRRLRTTLPVIPEKLVPEPVNLKQVQRTETMYKQKYQSDHDNRFKITKVPSLTPGDKVYLRDQGRYGEIVEKTASPRSYRVMMDSGNVVRRNRSALIHTGETAEQNQEQHHDTAATVPVPAPSLVTRAQQSPAKPPNPPSPKNASGHSGIITRSGRVVKSTKREDMSYD